MQRQMTRASEGGRRGHAVDEEGKRQCCEGIEEIEEVLLLVHEIWGLEEGWRLGAVASSSFVASWNLISVRASSGAVSSEQ
ncbi:hypothetical protein RIF29_28635 [Crotalaria pallida]|uniref:Uncharacterized protein n=1 Tax=Crotalaria pallida TaxID=3830 RepID=A0AAN9EE04_CROPI